MRRQLPSRSAAPLRGLFLLASAAFRAAIPIRSCACDDFLDFFLFLRRIFCGERLVVLGGQAANLLAVDLEHVVGTRFVRSYVTLTVELVLLYAFDIGVVALSLIVLVVLLGHLPNHFLNLLSREMRGHN